MNQADEVIYALQGVEIPCDVTDRAISAGDWVVRAIADSPSASLFFARAFPAEELTATQLESDGLQLYSKKLNLTLFTVWHTRLQKSNVNKTKCLMIIDEATVPQAERDLLQGTREELEARRNAALKADKDRYKAA